MLDLFDTVVVPGLRQQPDFLNPDEEQMLIERIVGEPLSPFRFQQWTGKRLTRSFGWSYDFQTGIASRTDPIPDWLEPIRARAAAFAGLDADAIVQALLIRYDPGAGIGWHKDRPIYEHVIGLSLGAPATLRLRRRSGERWLRQTADLPPRAIYHLSGEVRHEWEHSISPLPEPRFSITFRSFSERGRTELGRDVPARYSALPR